MDHVYVFVLYCNRFQICIVLKLHNLLGERVFVNLHLQANEVDSWLLPLIELFVQPKKDKLWRDTFNDPSCQQSLYLVTSTKANTNQKI